MKKIWRNILIVNAVLALLSVLCLVICLSLSGCLESQKAAQRWTGEGDVAFAQLSCYMTDTEKLSVEDIYNFRMSLITKLTEASMEGAESGNLYHDAWSAGGNLKVFGDNGSGDATVMAVGGDYFYFHPLTLLSGSYITEDDVMDDRVILDREMAWRLFGGVDLQGMTVTINDVPYVVAGVVDHEADFASKKAYTGGACIYMSYAAYSRINEDAGIECYEIVMPQPVDGFAEDILKTSFTIGGGEIINNSSRFGISGIFSALRSFGSRSMHTTSVIYPYWENAARCVEDYCAMLLALAMLFAVSPVIALLAALMVMLIRGKNYLSDNVPEWVSGAVDRERIKRYNKRNGITEIGKDKGNGGNVIKGIFRKRTKSGSGNTHV